MLAPGRILGGYVRELYTSSNGDRWHLVIDGASRLVFVRHTANAPSGGHVSDLDLAAFLVLDRGGPEHDALWALMRDLATDEA